MKTILCYGDSNTWGFNPADNGERHKYNERWTTVLQNKLGSEFRVIPEGLNGRTTVWDDPIKEHVNGKTQLLPTLLSHKPIDMVVLFLGTNDLKKRFGLTAADIAAGVGTLIDKVNDSKSGVNNAPDILVIIPPEVRKEFNSNEFFADSMEKSRQLPKYYKEMAAEKGVDYIEIGKHVKFSPIDGIHFEREQLEPLGTLLADYIGKKYNK